MCCRKKEEEDRATTVTAAEACLAIKFMSKSEKKELYKQLKKDQESEQKEKGRET